MKNNNKIKNINIVIQFLCNHFIFLYIKDISSKQILLWQLPLISWLHFSKIRVLLKKELIKVKDTPDFQNILIFFYHYHYSSIFREAPLCQWSYQQYNIQCSPTKISTLLSITNKSQAFYFGSLVRILVCVDFPDSIVTAAPSWLEDISTGSIVAATHHMHS